MINNHKLKKTELCLMELCFLRFCLLTSLNWSSKLSMKGRLNLQLPIDEVHYIISKWMVISPDFLCSCFLRGLMWPDGLASTFSSGSSTVCLPALPPACLGLMTYWHPYRSHLTSAKWCTTQKSLGQKISGKVNCNVANASLFKKINKWENVLWLAKP